MYVYIKDFYVNISPDQFSLLLEVFLFSGNI